MGLMGTSITACLLAAGHSVSCIEIDNAKRRTARTRLTRVLKEAERQGLLHVAPSFLVARMTVSGEFALLKDAEFVIESTVEDLAVKLKVINDIENSVSVKTLIGSNTSAIPVSELQAGALHPERILGLHWAEPANITRFMEIICGKQTSLTNARWAEKLARGWVRSPRCCAATSVDSLRIGSCTRCFVKHFISLILDMQP